MCQSQSKNPSSPLPLDGRTRLFPILGAPIIYARSPELLSASFHAKGVNALCVPMEVVQGKLDAVMGGLHASDNVDGMLITMPHKHAVLRHCASLSPTSQILQAVSVIRRRTDGLWHGDSQDGASFVRAQIEQGARVQGARALLIGAGGAGSAIAISLLEAGVAELVIHDLDTVRATLLTRRLQALATGRKVQAGPADPKGFNMVCHATNMGMNADDPLPLDPAQLEAGTFVGDVIAGHGITPLIAAARASGCATADGDQMVQAVQQMMVEFMLHQD